MANLKDDFFSMAMSSPASDLEEIRQEYLAANRIAKALRSKINKGKLTKAKLESEEK